MWTSWAILVLFIPSRDSYPNLSERFHIRSFHPHAVFRPGWLKATALDGSDEKYGTVLGSSLLVAGTTIGGGFLALPKATAPAGLLPSSLGLLVSWLFLLSSALSLADATIITKELRGPDNKKNEREVSIFSVCSAAFGQRIARVAALCFFVLMVSTLVAQLSKSGSLISDCFPALGGPARGTLLFAAVMASITFGGGVFWAELANSCLTAVMLLSFIAVAGTATRVMVPNRLFRANWNALIPSFGSTWSIPVLLQLLVYSETIPFIVQRLKGDRSKIRCSIVAGSFIPLLMCLVWTAAAIGAVPFDPKRFDPVQSLLLLQNGSAHTSSASSWLRLSILTLAGSAISTTVIGTLLTTTQFLEDIVSTNSKSDSTDVLPCFSRRATFLGTRAAALVPCALISAFGGPRLYYTATSFAGMFPVTLLWGLAPPAAFLRLASKRGIPTTRLTQSLCWLNIVISFFMLAFNFLSVIAQ